jgi:hypothetical protein
MATNSFCSSTCPDICTGGLSLPALPEVQDCFTVADFKESQVADLLIGAPADIDDPTDPTTALDWAGVIDNTDTTDTNWKHLVVEGEVPEPEVVEIETPKNGTIVSKYIYTLTMTVKKLDDATYAFLKNLQCGSTDLKFNYGTVGGRLFYNASGSTCGILPASVSVVFPLDGGREDVERAVITFTWESDCDPDRTDNPIS